MILTGDEIEKQVKKGNIHIHPFLKENLNPNSYNYRLGSKLLEIKGRSIDPKYPVKFREIKLTHKGFILKPNKLYLSHTLEKIGSDKYLTILIGRSSMGRLGLFLQITADLGHIKSNHCWTLELHTVQPLKVYPGMKIGQVSFWEVFGTDKSGYKGKYQEYSDPQISKIYEEFN